MTSSYKIDFTDGTSNPGNNPVEVARNTRDTASVDVTLFGRGTFNYGEDLNENLLHLLEHFASTEATRTPASTPLQQLASVAGIEPADNWAIRQPVPGQLWANKTSEQLFVMLQSNRMWDALANSGDFVVNWGVIAHGQTIPLPLSASGHAFTEAECAWIVAPSTYGSGVGTGVTNLRISSDEHRVVTAQQSLDTGETPALTNISASYMIVGIRDNVNAGDTAASGAAGGNNLFLFTTPVAVSGDTNATITGTLSIQTADNLGVTVDPATISFAWYRLDDGAGAGCSTVQYDAPVRESPTAPVFTFSAISQFAMSCNPRWRVVATDGEGRSGESIVQMVYNFISPQNLLTVSTNAISYASAETNATAEAVVTASVQGGVGPYTIEWSDSAIDGSGAAKTVQSPPTSPPAPMTGSAIVTEATYSLQRATSQTVFTRVSITVTDSLGNQARAFTTIRYNFIDASDSGTGPELEPMQMSVDGTLEGVYTIEGSAYINPTPGADNRTFTLTIPVQVLNVAEGMQLGITRLRDTDRVQFTLISPAVITGEIEGTFVFAITAETASNYPGTNSDAWRITFTAQDGRTISRDVITKWNYLAATRPLQVNVADVQVDALAVRHPTPAPTYVTLQAVATGGVGPYTYLWNTSAITSSVPYTVVGPLNRPTLTLQLRGTTYDYPQTGDVVWPAATVGDLDFVYDLPFTVTVRDSSLPSQQVSATATAGIHFNVDDSDLAIAPSYNQVVTDYTYNSLSPYTMKGEWICNSNFISGGPYVFDTFNRVTLEVIRGSGSYEYVWVEESRASGSTLDPVIVFSDNAAPNRAVSFKSAQTNCISGTRFYEGVWRCDVTDLHTGATLTHHDVVRIQACRGAPGSIDQTIQRVPVGVGFTCG